MKLEDKLWNDLLVKAALGDVREVQHAKFGDARFYATSHLADALGEQALPVLREVVRRIEGENRSRGREVIDSTGKEGDSPSD